MEIAADIKLKHADLYRYVKKHGYKTAAERLGTSASTLCAWVFMRKCPVPGKYTHFYTEERERLIEQELGKPAEELFPKEYRKAVEANTVARSETVFADIPTESLIGWAERNKQYLLEGTPNAELEAERAELKESVEKILCELQGRELDIVKMRFGLGEYDGRTHTLQEIAHKYQRGLERIRQILHQALLRVNKQQLEHYVDIDDSDYTPPLSDEEFESQKDRSLKDIIECKARRVS